MHLPILFSLLIFSPTSALQSLPLASRSSRSAAAAATRPRSAAVQLLFSPLPPEIKRIARPDWRYQESSCTEGELRKIWSAFEKVYGSREKALAASRKNQQVILPYVNSPETIIGAHKALVDMMGKEGAARIIEKNPGVLACNPATLATTSAADIERAANFVSGFDGLDPNVKAGIPFLTWFALVGVIGGRIASCGGDKVCGDADYFKGGLAVQLKQFLAEQLSQSGVF